MGHSLLNRATLGLAAGILAAMTGGAVADRVLTDPSSGQRLLLRDDGTYALLPPSGSGASGTPAAPASAARQSGAGQLGGNSSARQVPPGGGQATSGVGSGDIPNAPRAGGTDPAGAPRYTAVAFEDVARAAGGQRVSLDGWIGSFGTGDRFLMFRDRTVSPPYVVVRMSEGAIGASSRPGASSESASSGPDRLSGAAKAWAADVNQRCREACAARVQGEVVPAPPGGAPEIIAHHVDVSR